MMIIVPFFFFIKKTGDAIRHVLFISFFQASVSSTHCVGTNDKRDQKIHTENVQV